MKITTGGTACPCKCISNHKCVLNAQVPHEHHICRDTNCACHAAGAYGDELARGRLGYVYVPTGALLREPEPVTA